MVAANKGDSFLCDAVTHIPIYTGDGNDTYTPD
jgi:hypothetical protein